MNTENREHAILSPSFMHIALNCAGSIGLKEKLPPSPTNPQAEKGTLIHLKAKDHLAIYLNDKLKGPSDNKISYVSADHDTQLVVNEWTYLVWKHVFEESITGKAWDLEDRLTLSDKFSIWGTADLWMVATDERAKRYGFIADIKTGRVYVDEKSPQLPAYACGLRAEIRKEGKDLDYVKCAIYQPFSEGERWREIKYTSKQLDVWEKKFFNLAETVFSGKAKFKAGKHCKYCPGQAHCETYAKTLSKETALALLDPKEFQFPEPAKLSDQVVTNIVLHAKALETFVKACKKLVFEKLYNGDVLPNVKAVEGKGRRKIDDTKADFIEKECAKHDVCCYTKKLKGIGDLEKSLSFFLGNKESKSLVDSFTIMGQNPISLVPLDDPRPAVMSKIELLNNIEIEE